MPAVISIDRDSREMRDAAKKELDARRAAIEKRRRYYEGDHDPVLKLEKGTDRNVFDNVCEIIVDATADFLAADFPAVVVEGDDMATAGLRERWSAMDGTGWLLDAVTEGGLAGHNFARVTEDGEVINLDAANVLMWWNPDNHREVLWYELQWGRTDDGRTTHRQDIVPEMTADGLIIVDDDGRPLRWWIFDYVRFTGANRTAEWQLVEEPAPWNYPLSPVVQWAHLPTVGKKAYGQTELPDHALRMQNAINRITSDIGKIIEKYAGPTTVVTGAETDEGGEKHVPIGGMLILPAPDAKVYNIEMQSELVATRAERDSLKSALLRRSRVVVLPDDLNAFRGVTNLGIRTLYMPQTSKSNTLQRRYGDAIEAISRRLMMLENARDWAEAKIETEWGSALPTDKREELQLLQMMYAMGITSRRQMAQTLDIDYDAVRSDLIEERDDDALLVDGTMNGSMDVMR